MVTVALDWKRIDWMPNETWKKNILPKIKSVGLKPEDIKRSVYVIRLNGDFASSIRMANRQLSTLARGILAKESTATGHG